MCVSCGEVEFCLRAVFTLKRQVQAKENYVMFNSTKIIAFTSKPVGLTKDAYHGKYIQYSMMYESKESHAVFPCC